LESIDMIKFGQSSRLYFLMGPTEPEPEIIPQKVTAKSKPAAIDDVDDENSGVTWGMAEDAVDEDLALQEPIEGELNENAYYFKDPKKALNTWAAQKGFDISFSIEEEGFGINKVFVASVTFDMDSFSLTGTGRGSRKKEAEKVSRV
jgi:hypothetical protein